MQDNVKRGLAHSYKVKQILRYVYDDTFVDLELFPSSPSDIFIIAYSLAVDIKTGPHQSTGNIVIDDMPMQRAQAQNIHFMTITPRLPEDDTNTHHELIICKPEIAWEHKEKYWAARNGDAWFVHETVFIPWVQFKEQHYVT